MRYFRLNDDVHITGRWHLGDVVLADGTTPDLLDSKYVDHAGVPVVEISTAGRQLDFCLSSFAVPIARTALADVMSKLAGLDLQRIPIRIDGMDGFEALNALRSVRCLDERRSEFKKWTKDDHRADLAGSYRTVWNLRLEVTAIPSGCHLFRIDLWPVPLIASEEMRAAMEAVGCLGAKFEDVT